MKGVYRADAKTHVFVSSDIVPDDYVLKANESFDNPTGKVSPAKLQGMEWIDATPEEHEAYLKQQQEEYLASHPAPVQQPDKGDQAVNLLGQQFAQMQATQATLTKSVNALGQLVATQMQAKAPAQPTTPVKPDGSQPETQASTPQA